MWQYNQFKEAEKARKWRTSKSDKKLWKPKQRKLKWYQRRKFNYGKPTTIRHKGVR